MWNQGVAKRRRAHGVWRWVAATAMVIGALWAGVAFYEAAGRNASVATGPPGAVGASADSGGRDAMTTETTPHTTAAERPPMDAAPAPAVETATFALG